MRALAATMIDLRTALDNSCRERFALDCGTSSGTLSKFLNELTPGTTDLQVRIAKQLGLTPTSDMLDTLFRPGPVDRTAVVRLIEKVAADPRADRDLRQQLALVVAKSAPAFRLDR